MKIFLDARKLTDGGIGRFILNLLIGLERLDFFNDNELVLITSSDGRKLLEDNFNIKLPFKVIIDKTSKYSLKEYFYLAFKFKDILSTVDWYISPHYTLPFFIPKRVKKLVVVHDLIQVFYPENAIKKFFFHKYLTPIIINSSLKRAEKIVTVSNNSREKIVKYFSVCPEVIPNSVLDSSSDQISDNKNILFVGEDRQHKRLNLFLEFYQRLLSLTDKYSATVVSSLREKRSEELLKNVTILNNISDNTLFELYKNSFCLINCSVEEGFCIPLIESASRGIPVICPDLDFSREILGDSAWYFKDGSIEDLLRVFSIMIKSDEERNYKLRLGIEISKKYSVENQARKFIEIIS